MIQLQCWTADPHRRPCRPRRAKPCCTATRSACHPPGRDAAASAMPTPPMGRPRPPNAISKPLSRCWIGLPHKDLTLATAGQGDLDAWLASMQPALGATAVTSCAGPVDNRLTQPRSCRRPMARTRAASSTPRTAGTRRVGCCTDNTVDTGDRVAGLLVLLYAQTARDHQRNSRSTTSRWATNRSGCGWAETRTLIPAPLDNLLRELVENRSSGHAAVGRHCDHTVAVPPAAGRAVPQRLPNRRATASPRDPVQPSTIQPPCSSSPPTSPPPSWPAPSGFHISVAATWQRAAAGDWLSYAAEVSRRTTH